MLSAAAEEFADAEAMLQAGEKLFGPYRWDRLDLLVLPPSFPVGGMENPRLSFVSPTIIAGDKSLDSVIVAGFGAFLVGESGDPRDVARCMDQRGSRRLPGKPHRE